ncbi:hypothetical protein [Amycolatopsis anabasis]|uniref:hypothetical protein n=1 Tax=Amycolatopsis anabasis TaxID=1840409 RepID=UPI00131DEA83|nr:hypothetical protein [Amycolatopsis anabasis]
MTDPYGPTKYGRRRYEAEVYADESGNVFGGDPGRVAGSYSVEEGQRLEAQVGSPFAQGFREGLDPSDADYRAVPHQQLVSFVRDGVDPNAVDEQGMILNDLGNAQKELSFNFTQAAAKEESLWQGPAAEQAHGFFGELAKWTDSSGDSAFLASNRFSQQSAALVEAQKQMPPPAGRSVNESMDLAKEQMAGGKVFDALSTWSDMNQQAQLQRQAHDQAAAVVSGRDQTLFSTGSTQPSFAQPPKLPFSGAVETPIDGRTQVSSVDPGIAKPPGTSSVTPPGFIGGDVPPGRPNDLRPGVDSGRGQVPGITPPGYQNPPGWTRTPAPGLGPAAALGVPAPGLGQLGSEQVREGNRRGFPGSAARSAGGRISGFAGGAKPGAKPGAQPGTPEGPNAGKGTGSGAPGARGAAEVAAKGGAAAGAKGAAGMPAGAAGAGGKGKEEDKEHKRAGFLQENDPNEFFGTEGLDRTTPPVIGQ